MAAIEQALQKDDALVTQMNEPLTPLALTLLVLSSVSILI